jgi:nucleotide-binding universal stress UspA family protein
MYSLGLKPMFKHILVPLDGSRLAEAALPVAASLARTFNASVTLLHVIESEAPEQVHSERHLTAAGEAETYLAETASKAFDTDHKVEWHVHTAAVDNVPASLVEHAEELKPDLMIMCAHGGGRFRDRLFGNIAQQVISHGVTPVLMLQPDKPTDEPFQLKKILLPLDDTSKHDQSLPYARDLAGLYQAEIYMLTVIPTLGTLPGEEAASGSLLPSTTTAMLDIEQETAREHIQTHLDELRQSGFDANAEIARGEPAVIITDTANRIAADLIILSTHRRAGLGAFWARSVTPMVARRSKIPLLLIPL